MTAYLVRTVSDQTLIGVFCADSVKVLARIINEVFDARECEYLQMQPNEGLFVEGQFVTGKLENGVEEVKLVHADDGLAAQADVVDLTEGPSNDARAAAEFLMLAGEEDHIPSVLEPSSSLREHLQSAHRTDEWQPLVTKAPSVPNVKPKPTQTDSSINADRIARKLMEGALNPAMFIHNASSRHH